MTSPFPSWTPGVGVPLPLHCFNNLPRIESPAEPTFRGNEAKEKCGLVDCMTLERLTGSEPGWQSYIYVYLAHPGTLSVQNTLTTNGRPAPALALLS